METIELRSSLNKGLPGLASPQNNSLLHSVAVAIILIIKFYIKQLLFLTFDTEWLLKVFVLINLLFSLANKAYSHHDDDYCFVDENLSSYFSHFS